MIRSKWAKILLGIVFFVLGYVALSFAMFLGLQVDTRFGALDIVGSLLFIVLLVYLYFRWTKE